MIATQTAWTQWKPTATNPWTIRHVVHLHRRASFGATWSEIQRDLRDGHTKSITRILDGTSRHEGVPDDFDSMARVIGDAAVSSNNANRLKAWWVYRMIYSPDPLSEKLALMWHNHFATSNLKVSNLGLMREQNERFRDGAMGPFDELLKQVIKHPALLVWLDANENRKKAPNENLAREIMELFTLGVGNYSEDDVKEAARALTGWTANNGEFRFDKSEHDNGEKSIFGNTGKWNGDDLIGMLIGHRATAKRLAFRICEFLLGEDTVDADAIDELAAGLSENHLNIRWAVETVLRSEMFYAEENMRNRVVSPPEFVVGIIRSLEMFTPPPSTLKLADWITKSGQNLFYPANVFGWPGGRQWLTTRTLISRSNFVAAIISGDVHRQRHGFDADRLAKKHGRDDTSAFLSELLFGTTSDQLDDVAKLLSSPKMHLG